MKIKKPVDCPYKPGPYPTANCIEGDCRNCKYKRQHERKLEMEGMKSQKELADGEYVVRTATQSNSDGRCWYGKTCRDGCDKYKDGKCTGIVHPTYPPQLGDCLFANKNCPVGWIEVTAGDPETGSGQATLGYQRPISKDEYLKLSAPWITYVREVRALFGKDPQVRIVFDESNMKLRLHVDDKWKLEALKQLFPRKKEFGGVSLEIEVVPATSMGFSSTEILLKTAFKGNPVFFDADTVKPNTYKSFTYISFVNETVQLWNDNLADPHGLTTTLYQDIAKDVLDLPSNVYCCTEEGQDVIR